MVDNQNWYLAQLKPNSARIAQENLARQGFQTFLPMEERTSTRNGRFSSRREPVFPGYIFVSFDDAEGLWRKINATRGVTKLVSLRDGPTPVPTAVVAELIDRCDEHGTLITDTAFEVGDHVAIKSGPFADTTAEILKVDRDRRVWILMDVMGRETQTIVERDTLRRQ